MNSYDPYNQNRSYQGMSYFPQPQGNVYMVNNSLEVSNIPMGAGISVILCPSEGTMYIKTLQGGAPSLMVYNMTPYEQNDKNAPQAAPKQANYDAQIQELSKQIEEIRKRLDGGKLNELL